MVYYCPECHGIGTLEITHAIELPGDGRAAAIAIQLVICSGCGFQGVATYEQFHPNRSGDSLVRHIGYRVDKRGLSSLVDTIIKCPHPGNPACPCPSHRALNWQDAGGLWQGLDLVIEDTFPMRSSG
jgi:hypothetical protein